MGIIHRIADILIMSVNYIAKTLCSLCKKNTMYIEYMGLDLLKKYLRIGTKVRLVEWYLAKSVRISEHNFNERKSKYLGKVVTIRCVDIDGTFAIYEDDGRYWYDLGWIENIKQRTE